MVKSRGAPNGKPNGPRQTYTEEIRELQGAVDTMKEQLEADTFEYPIRFDDLPISRKTKTSIKKAKIHKLFEIQRRVIPHALVDEKDIMAVAETGSGKTLAFLTPMIENVYRQALTQADIGCVGLVLVPTGYTLGKQIFDALRDNFSEHNLVPALSIGGLTDRAREAPLIDRANVIVATPARLRAHCESTAAFSMDHCHTVVLDEADMLLDAGFVEDWGIIRSYLPADARTMMFSATMSAKARQVAQTTLAPGYLPIILSTRIPPSLVQEAVVVPMCDKVRYLMTFLEGLSARDNKVIVFFATRKQVKFFTNLLNELVRQKGGMERQLRYNGRIYAAASRQSAKGTANRMEKITKFKDAAGACLLSTDLAARGLDCERRPVDVVLQFDPPDCVETYVHRIGRTARAGKEGRSVIMFDSADQAAAFQRSLKPNGLDTTVKVRPVPRQLTRVDVAAALRNDDRLRHQGESAYVALATFYALNPWKSVFDIKRVVGPDGLVAMGKGYGLPHVPEVKLPGLRDEVAKDALRKLREAGRVGAEGDGSDDLLAAVDAILAGGDGAAKIRPDTKNWGRVATGEVDSIAGQATMDPTVELLMSGGGGGEVTKEVKPGQGKGKRAGRPDRPGAKAPAKKKEEPEIPKDVVLSKSQLKKKATRIRSDGLAGGIRLHSNERLDGPVKAQKVDLKAVAAYKRKLAQRDEQHTAATKKAETQRVRGKRARRMGKEDDIQSEDEEVRVVRPGAGPARVETIEDQEAAALAMLG